MQLSLNFYAQFAIPPVHDSILNVECSVKIGKEKHEFSTVLMKLTKKSQNCCLRGIEQTDGQRKKREFWIRSPFYVVDADVVGEREKRKENKRSV